MSRFFVVCLTSIIVSTVALGGNQSGDRLVLFQNGGTIVGTVYSDVGEALAGATVIFYSMNKAVFDTATTDIDGRFECDLESGNYFISAEAFNFSRQLYSNVYEFDKAVKISLSSSQIIELEFHLKPGGMIVGEIYTGCNHVNQLVVGAVKVDFPNADWRCERLVSIGNHGSYCLDGLLPGYYKVSVRGNGFLTQFYQLAETFDEADLLEAQVGQVLGNIDFEMERPGTGTVSGQLLDSGSGEPISNAEVWAFQSPDGGYDPNRVMVHSDGSGFFELEVTAGYYYVKANIGGNLGLGNIISIYYDNHTDPKLAEIIWASAGDSVTNIVLTVDLSRCYNLTVTGNLGMPDTGYPIEGARLMALDQATGRPVAYDLSGENGEFAINYLYTGNYIIEVSGHRIVPGFWPDVLIWQDAQPIVLASSGQNLYNGGAITQDYGTPGFSISGHIADEVGPLADTRIYAVNLANQKVAFGRSSLSGYYNIASGLMEGEYQLFADRFGYDCEYYPTTLYLDLIDSPTYEDIDFAMTPDIVGVGEGGESTPREIRLLGNYPNPFNSRTLIFLSADHAFASILRIYNLGGQAVEVLPVELVPGINTISWDGLSSTGESISSGLYFYRFDGFSESKKMILIK